MPATKRKTTAISSQKVELYETLIARIPGLQRKDAANPYTATSYEYARTLKAKPARKQS